MSIEQQYIIHLIHPSPSIYWLQRERLTVEIDITCILKVINNQQRQNHETETGDQMIQLQRAIHALCFDVLSESINPVSKERIKKLSFEVKSEVGFERSITVVETFKRNRNPVKLDETLSKRTNIF